MIAGSPGASGAALSKAKPSPRPIPLTNDFSPPGSADAKLAAASAASFEPYVGAGFTAYYTDSKILPQLTIRLVSNGQGNVESLRADLAGAAAQVESATGNVLNVAPGTVPDTSPDRVPADGEILISYDSSSTCSGDWAGCGGPRNLDLDSGSGVLTINAGRIWIHPNVSGYSTTNRQHVLAHELGHALGLTHYDASYNSQVQAMHSSSYASGANYRSGDLNGLQYVSKDVARESGTAVAADPSGRVWSFAITQAGTLKYRYTGGSGWMDWETVGTGYQSVAATIDGSGRVWMAVTTDNGALMFRRTISAPTASNPAASWGSWSEAQGVGDWVNLSANTDGAGRVWMFATKTNGDLYYKHQDSLFGWSLGFEEVGNSGWRSVSSATESDNGRVWVFATKTNGDLYYRYTDPSDPSGWAALTYSSSGWAGDVAAIGDDAGRIWMFGVKSTGELLYRRTDSTGWTSYTTVGAGDWASVSAGVQPDSTADGDPWMFATKSNGDLYYRHTNSTGWGSLIEVGSGGWK